MGQENFNEKIFLLVARNAVAKESNDFVINFEIVPLNDLQLVQLATW